MSSLMKFHSRFAVAVLALLFAVTCFAQDLPTSPPPSPAKDIAVTQNGNEVRVTWPVSTRETGTAVFSLDESKPLITSLGIGVGRQKAKIIATDLNSTTLLTIGERDLKPAGWVAFFDNPPKRPYDTFLVKLGQRRLKVSSEGTRTTISLADAAASTFAGDVRVTFYRNSPLLHVETVMTTQKDSRAIIYDAGLTSASPGQQTMAWNDV